MSTIAEFYSRNLATEVAKGMNQKAIGGGRPSHGAAARTDRTHSASRRRQASAKTWAPVTMSASAVFSLQ